MNDLKSWLAIHRIVGMGPARWAKLLQLEPCLAHCFNHEQPRQWFLDWCKMQHIEQVNIDWCAVEADLEWAQRDTNYIVRLIDEDYPPQLKQTHAAPMTLFVQGDKSILSSHQIALVGSRAPSSMGKENAFQFAAALARAGLTITSGLALGIDTASHEGTLSAAGKTIAVLGSGLDSVYPASNAKLAQRVIEQGALVTEYPLGTQVKPAHFPQRNRIISGLSWGVVVIEAALKSGSLITANYALDQGREVFALPGAIHNPLAKGCNLLIRQGAKCVESIAHIMEELSHLISYPNKLTKEKATPRAVLNNPMLRHIDEMCTPIDLVVARTGLTVQVLSPILLELELQGLVESVPGGYVRVA